MWRYDIMSEIMTHKQAKEIAQAILHSQGENYEDWLYNQHLKAIGANAKALREILYNRKEK